MGDGSQFQAVELQQKLNWDADNARDEQQQPGTPVYGTDLDAEGVRRALAEAKPERKPGFRAATAPKASAPRARGSDEASPRT